ncbi:MAG: hypothetical protein K8I00_06585, partial [Candidatus Omnitrophica bacterium]|nr:hypothetical protein [Candidatus Omnitrophota bacterium]
GHEHRIDSEGNETLRQFSQTVASEKAKTLDPSSRAWQDYVIRPLPFRVAASGRPLRGPDPVAEPRDVVVQSQTISGNDIYVAQESRDGKKVRITAYEHNAAGGRDILRIGAAEIPAVEGQGVHITATAVDNQNFYVGTVNGLLIFKRGAGQPLGESEQYAALTGHMGTRLTGGITLEKGPADDPGYVRYVTETSGLPDNRILSLAADGQRVYMGIGPLTGSPDVAGDCGFAVYRPADGTYEILATSRSRTGQNPLDAGKFYRIDKLLMATDGESVWLAVNGQRELNGLWQYHIATQTFEHRVPEVFPVLDMHWSRDNLLYGLWGSGIARYAPSSGRKEWLLGYVPSKFTPGSAPLPPADVKTNPVYGFARTRLWPFAVSGGDLFTFGWEFQDVLIHRAGQPAAAKSIFDPDAGVIAGKSYLLSGPDDSVWMLQSDGGGFLLRRREK